MTMSRTPESSTSYGYVGQSDDIYHPSYREWETTALPWIAPHQSIEKPSVQHEGAESFDQLLAKAALAETLDNEG